MSERVEISKRLVLINASSTLVTRLLSIFVLIWLQQYLLKRITPEEYSLLPVLYAIMMFAPLFSTVLAGGLGRYIVEAYAKKDDERIAQIVSTMFPILCVAGLCFLTLGWTFAWHIDKVLNISPERLWDARVMLALLMFSAAIRLPLAPFSVGLFVRQKFVLQNIIGICTEVFRLSLLFALLFGVSTRVMWVITASVCAEFFNLTTVLIVSRRLLPLLRFRRKNIHWPIAREITNFQGWQFVMALGNTIRIALDPIVLNAFSSSWDIACLHLAMLPFQHLWLLIGMLKVTVSPALTAMHAASEKVRLQSAYLRGSRLILWAFLFPTAPLALFSNEIIEIYVGPELWLAAVLLKINLFSFLICAPSLMFTSIAEATGQLRRLASLALTTHLCNLGITFFLVGYLGYGAIGSSVATALASVIFYPLFIWPLARKTLDLSLGHWIRETLWPGILPALVAAPLSLLFASFFPVDTVLNLLAACTFYAVVYGLVLMLFAAREKDREDLKRMAHAARRGVSALVVNR